MKEDKKKTDIETLCPEKIIEGFTLRPWSLRQTMLLMPIFSMLKDDIEGKGITIEKFLKFKPGDIFDLAILFSPYLIDIMAITLNRPKEQIDNLDLDKAVILVLEIFDQNIIYLKNCFGLVSKKINRMKLISANQ